MQLLSTQSMLVAESHLRFRLESHPDYPSLLAVKDTLEELSIESTVCRGTKEELKKIIFDESKELANLQLLKKPITQEYFLSLNNYFPEHFKFENHLNKNINGVYNYNSNDKNRFYKINGNFVFSSITNFNAYKKGNNVELKNIYLK